MLLILPNIPASSSLLNFLLIFSFECNRVQKHYENLLQLSILLLIYIIINILLFYLLDIIYNCDNKRNVIGKVHCFSVAVYILIIFGIPLTSLSIITLALIYEFELVIPSHEKCLWSAEC